MRSSEVPLIKAYRFFVGLISGIFFISASALAQVDERLAQIRQRTPHAGYSAQKEEAVIANLDARNDMGRALKALKLMLAPERSVGLVLRTPPQSDYLSHPATPAQLGLAKELFPDEAIEYGQTVRPPSQKVTTAVVFYKAGGEEVTRLCVSVRPDSDQVSKQWWTRGKEGVLALRAETVRPEDAKEGIEKLGLAADIADINIYRIYPASFLQAHQEVYTHTKFYGKGGEYKGLCAYNGRTGNSYWYRAEGNELTLIA